MKIKYRDYIGLIGVVIFFFLISYFVQTNMNFFENNLDKGFISILSYLLITIIATVFAPISAVPLLPIATLLWGWFFAAILSILGWTIGASIAFIIGRKFGLKVVKKFISLEKINYYEEFIPKKDLFLSIILIRIFLPVDILSYILAIFSKVSLKTYSLATLIGVTPFGFILAYLGSLSFKIQLYCFLIGLILFALLYYKVFKNLKSTINKNARKSK